MLERGDTSAIKDVCCRLCDIIHLTTWGNYPTPRTSPAQYPTIEQGRGGATPTRDFLHAYEPTGLQFRAFTTTEIPMLRPMSLDSCTVLHSIPTVSTSCFTQEFADIYVSRV
ncbi:hypothetical protein PMIN05_009042 [Paraphaeosphaeria minitans]